MDIANETDIANDAHIAKETGISHGSFSAKYFSLEQNRLFV